MTSPLHVHGTGVLPSAAKMTSLSLPFVSFLFLLGLGALWLGLPGPGTGGARLTRRGAHRGTVPARLVDVTAT